MSSTRRRHSLGGNNRLVKDSVAKLRLESRRGHEIDLMADEFTKLTLQADEFKQANGSVEFKMPWTCHCRVRPLVRPFAVVLLVPHLPSVSSWRGKPKVQAPNPSVT